MPTDTRTGSVPEVDLEVPAAGTAEYEHWQKTGELALPEKEEKKPEEKSEKPEESATSTSEAKKPEAAAVTETAPRKKTAEARLQQLLAERKQERKAWEEERRRLQEIAHGAATQPRTSAEPAPAKPVEKKVEARKRPEPGDKDAQGKPLYEKWGDYEKAFQDWAFEESERKALAKVDERLSASDKKREESETERQRVQGFANKLADASKKYPDFKEVAFNPIIPIPKGSEFETFILESDLGTDLAYYFGQNPAEAERISGYKYVGLTAQGDHNFQKVSEGLKGKALIRELTLLELSLLPDEEEGEQPKPAPKLVPKSSPKSVTAAPKPPHQVSGKSASTRDAAEDALDNDDAGAYIAEMNARDIAARKSRR